MAIQPDLYFISMAARLLDMHPQTLRKYERLGLIQPSRTIGSMRLYAREEMERLRLIKHLVDEVGVNLAGVHRLLEIAEAVQRLRPLIKEGRTDARRRIASSKRTRGSRRSRASPSSGSLDSLPAVTPGSDDAAARV